GPVPKIDELIFIPRIAIAQLLAIVRELETAFLEPHWCVTSHQETLINGGDLTRGPEIADLIAAHEFHVLTSPVPVIDLEYRWPGDWQRATNEDEGLPVVADHRPKYPPV